MYMKNRDGKPEQKRKYKKSQINFFINLLLKDCLGMEFIACQVRRMTKGTLTSCLLVPKVTVRQAPSYLTGMLTAVTEVPSLSTLGDASNGNYVIPRTRLKFGERAFCPPPRASNSVPTELKLMRSTPVFKRSLKTLLFQTAYCT